MSIFFDQGTPDPLRRYLGGHAITTAAEAGFNTLSSGDLLRAVDSSFDLFITIDQNIRYQQNVAGRAVSIIVLMTTSWPVIKANVDRVLSAVRDAVSGDYQEVIFPRSPRRQRP